MYFFVSLIILYENSSFVLVLVLVLSVAVLVIVIDVLTAAVLNEVVLVIEKNYQA